MKSEFSLSVIVPAYNEEGNLGAAIEGIKHELKNLIDIYEIIIINDGSRDNTSSVAAKYTRKNKQIKFINRYQNKGFGYTFREGLAAAKMEYITQFHADNDSSPGFLKEYIHSIRTCDLVMAYPKVINSRSVVRTVLSQSFVYVMNILFDMHLKYFNGAFICKTKILKSLKLNSWGLAIYAEAKVKLIKKGYAYKEIPFEHTGRKTGYSKAINLKSFWDTLITILFLYKDIYIKRV